MKGTTGRLCCMLGWRMKHWQVPVLFGGIRQIRAWADVFKKHFQKSFQNCCLAFLSSLSWLPVTTITPQNNKKKCTAYKQSKNEEETARGRQRETKTEVSHFWYYGLIISRRGCKRPWAEIFQKNVEKERMNDRGIFITVHE